MSDTDSSCRFLPNQTWTLMDERTLNPKDKVRQGMTSAGSWSQEIECEKMKRKGVKLVFVKIIFRGRRRLQAARHACVRSGMACRQGVEGSGMEGPGET
jgi:hypothetical protein